MRRPAFPFRSLVLVSLAVAACTEPQRTPNTIEVINWWAKDGEAMALNALISEFEEENRDQRVQNYFKAGSAAARDAIRVRMADGNPPDVFQANGGWDLLAWVLYDTLNPDSSMVEPLEDIDEWASQLPEPVLATVQVNSTDGLVTYAVPLNVHRVNSVFFNRRVLEAHGVSEPVSSDVATIDDFFALLESLRNAGVSYPLAIGTAQPWTLGLVFFENILVARAGGDYYQQFFDGDVDALTDPQLREAVRDFSRLMSYVYVDPRNAGQQTWDWALSQVQNGGAALTIMGDWAKGYFSARGGQLGQELKEIPMPGSDGTFVFTTDTFAVPKGARNREGAMRFLRFAASRPGQRIFNPLKGSISARRDDDSVYGQSEEETVRAFRAAAADPDPSRLVPATAIRAPTQYTDAIFSALSAFVGAGTDADGIKGNESVLLHAFKNWSDVLRGSAWP